MRALRTIAVALVAAMVWGTSVDAADARIESFAFSCVTPDGQTLKPKFGDIEGIFYTDLPAQREQCLEAVRRKISLCRQNVNFASNTRNAKHAPCLPIFEQQAEACIGHFTFEQGKCDAGGSHGETAEQGADDHTLEPFGPEWSITMDQPCQVWNYGTGDEFEPATWSGACVDGKASGVGRLTYRYEGDDYVYEGDMHAGKLHGRGTDANFTGYQFDGEFRDGWQHGRGTLRLDGSVMTCDWRNGEAVENTCTFR